MKRLLLAAIGILAAGPLLAPTPARAWGDDGHTIVAMIADKHLTEKTRARIRELTGNRDIFEAKIPVWADQIKRSSLYAKRYPKNDRFHYIDMAVDAAPVFPEPAAATANVLDAIERFKKDLVNVDLPEEMRKEALFFLVHLVGDVHQPLHCADLKGDRGGNLRMLDLSLTEDPHDHVKLHAYWDTNLVHDVMNGMDRKDVAGRLDDKITEAMVDQWQGKTVKEWILDTHAVAKQHAYEKANITGQDGIQPNKAIKVTAEYAANGKRVAALQLQKAGIRLAEVLNAALGD